MSHAGNASQGLQVVLQHEVRFDVTESAQVRRAVNEALGGCDGTKGGGERERSS